MGTLHPRVPLTGTSGHPGYSHTNGSLYALQVLEDTGRPNLGDQIGPALGVWGRSQRLRKHLSQEGVELLTPPPVQALQCSNMWKVVSLEWHCSWGQGMWPPPSEFHKPTCPVESPLSPCGNKEPAEVFLGPHLAELGFTVKVKMRSLPLCRYVFLPRELGFKQGCPRPQPDYGGDIPRMS